MKVKEFYDHITAHMTPEEALMKLLEGGVMQYEKLKFDAENQPVHPLFNNLNGRNGYGVANGY